MQHCQCVILENSKIVPFETIKWGHKPIQFAKKYFTSHAQICGEVLNEQDIDIVIFTKANQHSFIVLLELNLFCL